MRLTKSSSRLVLSFELSCSLFLLPRKVAPIECYSSETSRLSRTLAIFICITHPLHVFLPQRVLSHSSNLGSGLFQLIASGPLVRSGDSAPYFLTKQGETNFRLITARLRKTNTLPSQLTSSPPPPPPTHDPRNRPSVFSTQQIICKMAAEPNYAHLFITERHLDEPPNERLASQNDRQRRDKQRQVTVLWPVHDVKRYRRTAAQTLFRHGSAWGDYRFEGCSGQEKVYQLLINFVDSNSTC